MSAKEQRIATWCGIVFTLLFGAGLFAAHWMPLPGESLTADQVAAMYREHTTGIRVGMIIMLQAAGLYYPFVAVTAHQLRRIQGSSRVPATCQVVAGTANAITFLVAPVLWAATALRPERDPQLLYAMNDIAWLLFTTPGSPAQVQNMSIAVAIFMDRSARPVFPRWFAYMTVWQLLLIFPTELPFFFKTGPFAWNGALGFYIAATAWFVWIITLVILLFKAINREENEAGRLSASGVPLHSTPSEEVHVQ